MKRLAAIILAGMLLFCIHPFTDLADAATTTVVIELDVHEVTVGAEQNLSKLPVVWGKVTCSIEGINADFQSVEVTLRCSGGWPTYGDLFPNDMTFTQSGEKPFNVTLYVSNDAPNNSTMTRNMLGTWEVHGSVASQVRQTGDATPDSLFVKINRTFGYYENQEIIVPGDLTEQINEDEGIPWQLSLIIAVPILLVAFVVVLIIVFKFRRKKAKQRKGRR